MAGTAEAWPSGESEPMNHDALIARTEVDNFKVLFEVYLKISTGEELQPDLIRPYYHEYLLNDPNGQATVKALDELKANLAEDWLFEEASAQLIYPELSSRGDEVFYEMVGRTAVYLPPGLGVEILLDPRMADEAA